MSEFLQADLTWRNRRFVPNVVVEVDDTGRIATVAENAVTEGETEDRRSSPPLRRLSGKALLPGFVNAHSHAFQRGLRGRGETFPAGAGSFWTWREAMYGLVDELDEAAVAALSRQAFAEMRAAGITTVGEFHYLHHQDAEARDFRFDGAVLRAAAEVGIRIVLLQACYAAGGVGKALAGGQKRFATPSLDEYWRQMDELSEWTAGQPDQTLGVVAHSLRAVPPKMLRELHRQARHRGLVLHMHLEEQRQEIAEVEAAWGARPMELLLGELELDSRFTAVHCTHSDPGDLERFLATGAHVCVCPLTEANLGDGLPPLGEESAGSLCLGTDSNARISMLEEARWLEYGQRLRGARRGALRDGDGAIAPNLLAAATRGGAEALGLAAGEIAAGRWADFALVDLEHPSLAGADADILAAALLCGSDNQALAATCVGGRWTHLEQDR
ncbi:MAG: formimidoylglutamate deiminase [Acidobacteriota bacterium]